MDTEEYYEDSLEEEDDFEDEEEEEEEEDDDYFMNHVCKECTKCASDRSYEYVPYIKPVVFNGVPKLATITTARVAVALWHHVNVTHDVSRVSRKCVKSSLKWKILSRRVSKLAKELPIPKLLKRRVKAHVENIDKKITTWVSYHFRTVFLRKGQDNVLYSLIYHIVWYPNGTINCRETARNMLSSIRLSDVEKFKFFSTYCLKEEIEKLSPSLFVNVFLEYVNFNQYPLIYYWYCYFKNELNKIPVSDNQSVDIFMFRHERVDNWPAKEYFFDRMSTDEQVQQAIWLIDRHEVMFQKAVLSKLNDTQRLFVHMERSVEIAAHYAQTGTNSKDVLSTWCEIRNLITQDQFVNMFKKLFRASTIDAILTDVWTSASNNYKKYLLEYESHAVIDQMLNSWTWAEDSEFIFTVIRDASEATRKSIAAKPFFSKYFEKILRNRDKFSRLERLLNLCLPRAVESLQFKKYLADRDAIKNLCLIYYRSEKVDEVNDLLNLLFASNTSSISDYKKTLIMSSDAIETCVSLLDWKNVALNEIVADTLPTADLVNAFKKKMLFSQSAFRKFKMKLNDGKLADVQKYTEEYLSSNEDKTAFKKQFIANPETLMREVLRKYEVSFCQTLMMWLFEDESLLQDFKRTLDVDAIFKELLTASVFDRFDVMLTKCRFHYRIDFTYLDRFLSWYFQSPNEVKQYKIQKVHSFKNIEMITTLMKKKDTSYLKTLMKWFFQDDDAEIYKFKAKHGYGSRICEYV